MNNSKKQVRYAVVGAGNIAQVAVLPAFRHSDNSTLAAVISGDAEKREALRARYDLGLVGGYDQLESVLQNGAIDAVYVATPNALHKEVVLRAAAMGVHVLCEKPLAPTADDCRTMGAACAAAQVKLMVAYRLHFEPATLDAMEIVRTGQLGDPCLFESVFSHVVRAGDIRSEERLAGGATYDLGVYCINAARNFFEAEPTQVLAHGIERNGIDDTMTAILRFSRNRIAQFFVSNSAASVSSYRIVGTEGDLRVEPGYEYAEGLVHTLTTRQGDDAEVTRRPYKQSDQFAPELSYFSDCILTGNEPEPNAEEAWCDLRVVEAILTAARTNAPVTLEPYQRGRRPRLDQARREPAVKKPQTINAPSPSLR
jgi:predicted dehydrogenase